MSRIRSKNTKPDLQMKKILSSTNYRYTMYPKMYGNPDFIIKDKKIVIFCDGNFWHGYRYYQKKRPAKEYWRKKIESNMIRDKTISRNLRSLGWSVLRFWEHDIKNSPMKCRRKIVLKIKNR